MRAAQAFTYLPRLRAAERRVPRALPRLQARVRGPRVDRELARGIATWHSPLHAERALYLTSNRTRNNLARSLDRLLAHAEMTRIQFVGTAVAIPCREQVREALPQILELAFRLRDGRPVGARGVAQLETLLCDGSGPCYSRSTPQALAAALEGVSRWLDIDDYD
jgi:hypothetical protein